jgi:hypothetical protein
MSRRSTLMVLFRRIVEDYEAHLAPSEASADRRVARGKAEHERFEDGEVQFELTARGLEIADGAEEEIRLNGGLVARAAVSRSRISLRLSNRASDAVPVIHAGDRIEIAHRSAVLLLGSFAPD